MRAKADGPSMGTTTISVPEELADELYARKGRGESYADVIRRLLDDEPDDDTDNERHAETPTADSEPASFDELVNRAAERLPGSGEKHECRVAAFEAVVTHLRETGSATPAEFRESVYDDHPAGYATGRSWWKNAIYPALGELAEHSDAVKRADESGEWTFVGGEIHD